MLHTELNSESAGKDEGVEQLTPTALNTWNIKMLETVQKLFPE